MQVSETGKQQAHAVSAASEEQPGKGLTLPAVPVLNNNADSPPVTPPAGGNSPRPDTATAFRPVVQKVGDPSALTEDQTKFSSSSTSKKAEMRTTGQVKGSAPYQDPPGYHYIRAQGITNEWIRFHLINNIAGGPGNASNLVPASQVDNQSYEGAYENDLKQNVNAARIQNAFNGNNNKQVYFGVEVKFLPAPSLLSSLRDQVTGTFPDTMDVYHKKSNNGGASWQNVAVSNFTFQGKNNYKVPLDTTQALSVSDPNNAAAIKDLLRRGNIKYPDDVYTYLTNNTVYIQRYNQSGAEEVEKHLGMMWVSKYTTLEFLANGDTDGDGLINLSRMLAYKKILP